MWALVVQHDKPKGLPKLQIIPMAKAKKGVKMIDPRDTYIPDWTEQDGPHEDKKQKEEDEDDIDD